MHGITGASQDITQVSDRWHILKQLFEAVKQTLNNRLPSKWRPKTEHHKNRSRSFTLPIDQSRWEGEERRWLNIQYAQELYKEGVPIARIAKRMGRSRGTIYKYLSITERPNHKRASSFDWFRSIIHSHLEKGKTGNDIEKECRRQGYTGSRSTLNRLIAEER